VALRARAAALRARRAAAAPPFRGPAADSVLGELLIDVLHIAAAAGFAAKLSHLVPLCGVTWRAGDKGANNDMLVKSLERQCGAKAAHAAKREDFTGGSGGGALRNTTQLIRAAFTNDLPRVLQLVQLGTQCRGPQREHHGDALGVPVRLHACCKSVA